MRMAASGIAAILLVLATIGLFTSGGTARAQLGKSDAAPAAPPEPVRALLQVDPPAGKEAPDAQWQRTINTHTTLLHEPGLLRAVVASDEVRKTAWYAQFKGDGADARAAAALGRSLAVRPVENTALIEVRPVIEPPAEAAVIANAICDRYLASRTEQRRTLLERENDLLQRQLNTVKIELDQEVLKLEHQRRQELGMEGIVPSAQPGAASVLSALAIELQELAHARVAAENELDSIRRAAGAAAEGDAAPKAALKDAEQRVKQLAERQDRLQERLARAAQSMYELRLLDERESELRRMQSQLNERISNLNQIELQRPVTDVRVAARASAP